MLIILTTKALSHIFVEIRFDLVLTKSAQYLCIGQILALYIHFVVDLRDRVCLVEMDICKIF